MQPVSARELQQRQDRGRRIAVAAAHAGLTLAEVADRAGVQPAYLSLMVSGERPGTKHLGKIAKATKVPKCWIELGEGWSEAPTSARRSGGKGRQVNERGTRVISTPELAEVLGEEPLIAIELAPSVGARVVREMVDAAGLRGVGRVRKQDRVVVVVHRG